MALDPSDVAAKEAKERANAPSQQLERLIEVELLGARGEAERGAECSLVVNAIDGEPAAIAEDDAELFDAIGLTANVGDVADRLDP